MTVDKDISTMGPKYLQKLGWNFFFRDKGIKEFKTLIKNKDFFVKIYTLQQFFFRNLYYL